MIKMTAFNEHNFEKRLQTLKDSQESIQSFSAWCLQHRQHHKKIVNIWLKVLKKVRVEHRLTLFYLANDVIQYSKRKQYEFVQSWGTALQRATTMVREEKVKHRILRIFKIWSERGIYDDAFISDLVGLISATTTSGKSTSENPPEQSEFQSSVLISKIESCKNLEEDTDLKLKKLNESKWFVPDADVLRSNLKDRRQGDDAVAEVDDGIVKMEAYVTALEVEIKERNGLLGLLDQAGRFYDTQKGEAKVVANAYRNFGSRVKNLKRRLEDLIPTLQEVSPIPSPDVNAPSPSPDSDIELPNENANSGTTEKSYVNSYSTETHPIRTVLEPDNDQHHHVAETTFSSFMGNTGMSFDFQRTTFADSSRDSVHSSHTHDEEQICLPGLDNSATEGKPIEVINSRSKPEETFNISNFLQSLMQSGSNHNSTVIPGLGLGEGDVHPVTPPIEKNLSYEESAIQPPSSEYDYPISSSPIPLQPPPMPPSLFSLDETSPYKYGRTQQAEDSWNTKLPPKFPTWGDTSSSWEVDSVEKVSEWMPVLPVNKQPISDVETPESPPMYEKEGFSDPVEYDDSVVEPVVAPTISSAADVDHRTLVPLPLANHTLTDERLIRQDHLKDTDHRMLMHIPPPNHQKKDIDHRSLLHRKKDVDHRNLISLTGSPIRESHKPLNPPPTPPSLAWSTGDQDYRTSQSAMEGEPSTNSSDIMIEEDVDYRIPPPSLSAPLKSRDENLDNVESVDMEMSDEEGVNDSQNENFPGKDGTAFSLSSHSKSVLHLSQNENKDDSRGRNRVYGCQKIPTIGGINNSPRPRAPFHSIIARIPPPPPPPPPPMTRNLKPLVTPPLPPPQLGIQSDLFTSSPRSISISENASGNHSDEERKVEMDDFQSPPPKIFKCNSAASKNELVPDLTDDAVGAANADTININRLLTEVKSSIEETGSNVETVKSEEQLNSNWGSGHSVNNEPWSNDDLPTLDTSQDMGIDFDKNWNSRGRGLPFRNFPSRGGFPRQRPPMWVGPRRGGPPPRFQVRPTHDAAFGRGLRGGFRPIFRGNPNSRPFGW